MALSVLLACILSASAAPTGWESALSDYLGTAPPPAETPVAAVSVWLEPAARTYVFSSTACAREEAWAAVSEAVAHRALASAGLAGEAAASEAPEAADLLLELARYDEREYPRLGEEGPFPAFDLLVRRLPGCDGRPDWSGVRAPSLGRAAPAPEGRGVLNLGRVLEHSRSPGDSDWVRELPAARKAPLPPSGLRREERRALAAASEAWSRGTRSQLEATCRAQARLDHGLHEPWLMSAHGAWYRAKFLPVLCARDHARCPGHIAARAAGREDDPTGDGKGCDEAPYHLWLASVAEQRPAPASCGAFVQKIFEEQGFLDETALERVCAGFKAALEGSGDHSFCPAFARAGRPYVPEPGEGSADSAETTCRALASVPRGPAACVALDGEWRRICLVGALTWEAAKAADGALCRGSRTCLAAVGDGAACGPGARAETRGLVCAAFAERAAPRLDAVYRAAFERAWAASGAEGRAWLERLSAEP